MPGAMPLKLAWDDFARPLHSSLISSLRISLYDMASSSGATQSLASTPATLIRDLRLALNSSALPLSRRYRALFGLKHHACLSPPSINSQPAIEAMASAFGCSSALLKHEIAYCLGQTRNLATAPYLRSVLGDMSEDAMVRHESAEALGALGDVDSLQALRERASDALEEDIVRETCEIAIGRIEWEKNGGPMSEKLRPRCGPNDHMNATCLF